MNYRNFPSPYFIQIVPIVVFGVCYADGAPVSQSGVRSTVGLRNIRISSAAISISGFGINWSFAQSTLRSRSITECLTGFIEKLKAKGQSDVQRQHARRSIAFNFRMIGAINRPQPRPAIQSLKVLCMAHSYFSPYPNANIAINNPVWNRAVFDCNTLRFSRRHVA